LAPDCGGERFIRAAVLVTCGICSPGKAHRAAPGQGRWMLKNIPEAMLRICPGYRTYEPVAPVSVARPVNDR